MKEWLTNLEDFYFDDKGDYPINMQESDYAKYLNELSFAQINIPKGTQELLLIYSLDLADFPHNLIQSNLLANECNYYKHEEVVFDKIVEANADFISFHLSISNIISFEWYIKNGGKIEIPLSKFSIEAWIPTVDDDITLKIGYDKLKPLIIDEYQSKISTKILPEKPISSIINIYMAHGVKGIDGFRSIYTHNTDGKGHAIIKEKGLSYLFGEGTIAILFVCDSASITKELYKKRLNSLTYRILSLGYKAVIASAWRYNPDISNIWLTIFLENLKLNKSVGQAVHLANQTTAKKGYNKYHGFYSPTGWAAMQLYGNPNIYFV